VPFSVSPNDKIGCKAELVGGLERRGFRGFRGKGDRLRGGIAVSFETSKTSFTTQISVKAAKSSPSDWSQ
jgi:hypothetical protein